MAEAFGALGDTVETLLESGFFRWFNLEADKEPTASRGEQIFRPAAAAFRPFVSLQSRASRSGKIASLTLRVRRDFIMDPRQGPYARDIIKSFCLAATPTSGAMAALADEIMVSKLPGPIIVRGALARPIKPSGFLLAVIGERLRVSRAFGPVRITFTNKKHPEAALIIVATRGGVLNDMAVKSLSPEGVFARMTDALLAAQPDWDMIQNEETSIARMFSCFVAPLAAITPLCLLIRKTLIPAVLPGLNLQTPPFDILRQSLSIYVMALVTVAVSAITINVLAPVFSGVRNGRLAFKLSAYAIAPIWLSGILMLTPIATPVSIIADICSLYLLYTGLPKLMKSSRDRAMVYALFTALFLFCFSALISSFMAPMIGRLRLSV